MVKRAFIVLSLSCAFGAAWPLTFTGSSGSLSATADFQLVGNVLTLTLTNTSLADCLVPADALTSVFFQVSGNPTLTPVSAYLPAGHNLYKNGSLFGSGSLDLSTEWAYKSGISVFSSTYYGISSAGLGLFGPHDIINEVPGADPDGLGYGILSAGDDVTTGNTGLLKDPMAKYQMVFTLNTPQGLTLDSIKNVRFQYGTALTEPGFPGNPPVPPNSLVPGPAAIIPFGLGLLASFKRRKK